MTFRIFEARPAPVTGSTRTDAVVMLKDLLKSVGWTVLSSGDGTNYNPAGDLITHGGSGAGGLGNTNAWFRIARPAGGLPELSFQRVVNDSSFRIKMARAPMNAGAPSATQTPTTAVATDEIIILGAGTDAAPSGSAFGFNTNDGNQNVKAAADDAAPYGFWMAGRETANAQAATTALCVFDPLIDTIPGDAFTYWMKAGAVAPTVGVLSSATAVNQFTYVASATPSTAVIMPSLNYLGNSVVGNASRIVTTSEGRFRLLPVVFARRAGVANPGYKGVSTMLRWLTPSMGSGGGTGTNWVGLSVLRPYDYIALGDVALPWNGTRPPTI